MVMSNVVQRIFSNAVLFALFMSVSLTLHASNQHTNLEHPTVLNNSIALDIPDQATPDFDEDSFVDVISLKAAQPLPKGAHSFYKSSSFSRPFSTAYQRGPPVI